MIIIREEQFAELEETSNAFSFITSLTETDASLYQADVIVQF